MIAAAGPRALRVEPLRAASFGAFGDVIETASARQTYAINEGTAQRFHDLARVETDASGGRTLISIFRAQARQLPFEIRMFERHPLGSQAFIPLLAQRYLIAVAASAEVPPRVFLADAGQGINYHRGTWHHPLLALDATGDFLVVDRGGPGENCEEFSLAEPYWIESIEATDG